MRSSKLEVTVWLSVGAETFPRKVCVMTYEQWRTGYEIPRLSLLEIGEPHPACLPQVPLYDRLRGLVVRLRGILRGRGDRQRVLAEVRQRRREGRKG